ncbi:IclR family transcriptional regulator [Ktedonosporobacter rubrisoli]|nr:IclR family transcriptional regulator [Ktedonosporobacter rubrisoli]
MDNERKVTTSAQAAGKTPKVEAVLFVDQILSCFSVDTPALSGAEIARMLHIPKARIHRFLISMEQVGYVQRVAGAERYALGMRLYALGMLAVNGANYLERISTRAQELSERYGYTAVVGVLADNEFVAVRTFMPARSLGLAIHTGFRSPAYATAQGRVSLAFLPAEKLRSYFQTTELRSLTPETLTDPQALQNELAIIRQQRFAIAHNQTALGATAIAAPIFDIQGQVMATLSLVWFTAELTSRAEELGILLRGIGLEISTELGFRIPTAWRSEEQSSTIID